MRKIINLLLVIFIFQSAVAQNTISDPNVEKRNITGFHAISVSSGIDLILVQGDEAVAVSASELKYRDRIQTEVKEGVLKIWYEHENRNFNISFRNIKLKAYVSCKTLDGLKASGGSDIVINGVIKTGRLDLSISGGSDIRGKMEATDLKATASGGSDIMLSGIAQSVYIHTSGGSDFKGTDFIVENCFIDASGGSDVSITVNKELSVEATGGSDVHYKGTGLIRDIKNSGGGSIKRITR